MSLDCYFQGFLKNAPSFNSSLQSVVTTIEKITDSSSVLTQSLCTGRQKISSMKEEVTKMQEQLKEYESLNAKVRKRASTFVCKVNVCLESGELSKEREHKIKQDVRNGNFRSLYAYMDKFSQLFDQSESAYAQFGKEYELSEPVGEVGIETCQLKTKEAQSSKRFTQILGGTLATIAGVGGIAGISVVIGLGTFGIGAPLVLGISGVASGVVGATTATTTGVVTHKYAMEYEEAEKIFKEIYEGFLLVKENTIAIDLALHKLSQVQKDIGADVTLVRGHTQKQSEYESFYRTFDILLKGVKGARRRVHECSEKLQHETLKIE